jgi:hypothetical protein
MTFHTLTPHRLVVALFLLAVGIVLMVVSQRRGWRPSLLTAIVLAAVLRGGMLFLAWHIRPYDLYQDFWHAGVATLHHQDPILNSVRPEGWASLPTYTFPLAGAAWTVIHLHWSWLIVARIPAILSDLGVVVVVGALVKAAGGSRDVAALRRFQYACNPVAILVSSVHGQLEPFCLLFAFAAFAVVLKGGQGISARRAVAGGAILAVAISGQSWPVLFLPALLIALPTWRRRLQAVAGAAAVGVVLFATMPLTVGSPVSQLPHLFKHMLSNQPPIGTWGWSGLWVTLHPTGLPPTQDPLWVHVGKIGEKAALLVVLIAIFWWRRAHPLDVATASVTTLIVVSPGIGIQYLQWPVPSSTARPTRLTLPLQIVAGLYAFTLYLPMNMLTSHNWHVIDRVMIFISLGIVVLMVVALPWGRRVWDRSGPGEPGDEGVPALDTLVSGPASAEVRPQVTMNARGLASRPPAGLLIPVDKADSKINPVTSLTSFVGLIS